MSNITILQIINFARGLFGEFRDHFFIANINARKHKSCVPRLTRPELTANINPREHGFVLTKRKH